MGGTGEGEREKVERGRGCWVVIVEVIIVLLVNVRLSTELNHVRKQLKCERCLGNYERN